MDYSEDLLKKIKELAESLTPPQEIAALTGLNELTLMYDINTPDNPARIAFMQGYSATALKLRKQNLELTDAGSPAADDACRSYMRRMLRDIDL